MNSAKETLVCVDIESNGPVAGMHSMISFAAVAFKVNGEIISEFSRNLKEVDGFSEHPETMRWWKTQEQAWNTIRQDQVDPACAMEDFSEWIKQLTGPVVLVSHPASFDYSFLHWYSFRYLGGVSFHIAGLDIPSYAMAVLNKPFIESKRKFWPDFLNEVPSKHTHMPIDDARGHALAFCNLIKYRNEIFESSNFSS